VTNFTIWPLHLWEELTQYPMSSMLCDHTNGMNKTAERTCRPLPSKTTTVLPVTTYLKQQMSDYGT